MPLAQTSGQLRLQPWDATTLTGLFDDLEFAAAPAHAGRPKSDRRGFDVRRARYAWHELGNGCGRHAGDGRRAGLTVVGTHLPHGGDATAMAVAAADGEGDLIPRR